MDQSSGIKGVGVWPTAMLSVAAIVAGFNWLPLRYLQDQGLASAWAGLVAAALGAFLMLPAVPWRGPWSRTTVVSVLLSGLANGGALAFYCASLLLTDVVRALLLFYIAPIWGAILGCLVLGERLTAARLLAIALSIAGLLAILGNGRGWPWPHNIGDWLALVSGIAFAYGSLRVYGAPEVRASAQTISTMFGCVLVSALILLLLPTSIAGSFPALTVRLLVGVALFVLAMVIPLNWVWLWCARHLPPARVGLIFALEAVVGVASAAILTEEPFGWRETLGAALVIGSIGVDVAGHRPLPPQRTTAQ